MKQFWKKIIVSVIMIAIFLAPVSGGFKNKTVLAQSTNYNNLLSESSVVWQNSSQKVAEFLVNIKGPQSDWEKIHFANYDALTGSVSLQTRGIVLVIMENGNYVSSYDFSVEIVKVTKTTGVPYFWTLIGPNISDQYITVGGLTADKSYTAELYYTSLGNSGKGIDLFGSTDKNYYKFGTSASFSTPKEDELIKGDLPIDPPTDGINTPGGGLDLGCSLNPLSPNLTGCIAGILYLFWEASAWVARLAGSFLDFFVYYSTNSSSYDNTFVEKAWGAVRDVANIFFIIALLYVALKTILGLNVTDNKKLISAVILVALIINFSLFTTKVVIDASNILAKVFYNNITSKDANTQDADGTLKDSEAGVGGQKSVSIGIINKFDPQEIMSDQTEYDQNAGTFIFITILALVITLFTAYIFFSVALLFVARVVSLWISMVFSPIAFASYTIPFNIPGFGHKEWWDDLLKNAFLAPFFIFFLYIIILFTDFLKTITIYPTGSDTIQHLMGIVIPFAIIFILLLKAKHLAVKLSGSIGAAVNKIGAVAGGLALGAATGGTAMLGRATLGRAGAAIASSGALKAAEARGTFGAKQLRSSGSGSMDLRGIKVGGRGLANAGLTNIGKPKEGGFAKARADKVIDRQKRAKELEVGEDEKSKQNIYKKLDDLDKAKSDPTRQANIATYTKEVADAEKELVKTERELKDAIDKFGGNSAQANSQRLYRDSAVDNVEDKKRQLKIEEQPIKDAEKALKEAQNEVVAENRTRRENYAKTIQGGWSQTINFITSRGQHSFRGEREAANKILAGIQEEKK
ncbi:MAG: hypothetical protein UR70_C0004G0027 [Candidatus Nomurabacteria bacterium GW2011_GWB1_35_20]|uniref:TrbL/VirB6 plasmid conjugal transfer protein n=1 Tax=Candidatus Nomurabacteria bacterium GW2011_GWB1_35_20 TaxID=1618740 RepID=A0A0G0BTL1_9BACT|nr:MAG: hypothetical protein UR70_C0004G0027 [Candidatus Nomurabacteria bacterium GW2011_GWB1_35_20]